MSTTEPLAAVALEPAASLESLTALFAIATEISLDD
jgi:hypothetical protein